MLRFLIIISFGLSINSKAIVVNIAYEDKEQPPYYLGNGTEVLPDNPGVVIDMLKIIDKKYDDIEIKFQRFPWARCKVALEKGQVDAIFNASFKKSRMKLGRYPMISDKPDYSKRITTISYGLYVKSQDSLNWDGKSITGENLLISAPRGYSIVGDLKSKGINVVETNSSYEVLDMVLLGRVSAGAMQTVTANAIIESNKMKLSQIKLLSPPLAQKHYYLMISHQFYGQYPIISERIWDELKNVRETKFNQLVKKY